MLECKWREVFAALGAVERRHPLPRRGARIVPALEDHSHYPTAALKSFKEVFCKLDACWRCALERLDTAVLQSVVHSETFVASVPRLPGSCMVPCGLAVADVGPSICVAHEPHGLVGVHRGQMQLKCGCGTGNS